jgi:H+/Cl- antiporter ClcA
MARAGAWRLAILVAAGCLVGLIIRLLGPSGSVDAMVDNIHVHGGHHALRPLRSLIPAALVCVGAGGTLGPEAPLVETNGTLATWIAMRLGLERPDRRVVTIAGMASALAVLFGAPFGAAVFALELPHRRGMEYSEAILPACTGATIGWAVDCVLRAHDWEPVWSFGPIGHIGPSSVAWGALAGVVGAAIGTAFSYGVRGAMRVCALLPGAVRPALGGLALGLLSLVSVYALSNGEFQFDDLGGLATGTILVAAACKFLGALIASATGWKGGFIIPLFFIGGAAGLAMSRWLGVPAVIFAPSCMVAANAAVTRTPLGSALTVAEMAGLPTLPPLFAASVVSTVLTDGMRYFTSQRSRHPRHATAH